MNPRYDHLSSPTSCVPAGAVPDALGPIAAVGPATDDGARPVGAGASSVAMQECGEAMVDLTGITGINAYHAVGWPGTAPQLWLRQAVLDRLHAAQACLPEGFGLAVYDAWRSPATVRALWDHYYGPASTLEPGFLADPDDPDVIPPHSTGAAVDLTLTWQGTALSLGTAFDDFSDLAHLRALEHTAGVDRDLRRLLHHAMVASGFTPNPLEWWHYSHGDQAWAAATGAPVAPYGSTRP